MRRPANRSQSPNFGQQMSTTDPSNLERFVAFQALVIATVLAELRAGRKRSHWMWLVFPQLRGPRRSSMATFYGVASLLEARAYLAHPILGPSLNLCIRTVLELESGGSGCPHGAEPSVADGLAAEWAAS